MKEIDQTSLKLKLLFCEDVVKRMRRQAADQEKTFAQGISDKRLLSKI